jgi:NAD(P)-dependent dehydrogenase (short-subunit alcohol dehydrogenase family)
MANKTEGTKVALVTGATSGIGKACASALSKAGWKVYGTGRKPSTYHDLPSAVKWVELDVRSDASVEAVMARIATAENKLDLLVSCAGMGIAGSIEDSSMEDIALQMDVNFFGTVRTVKAFLPMFRKQGTGKIVIIGSLAGRIGMPFQAFYSSSKFALEGFLESLRHETRKFGIAACIVEPGDFHTGFTSARRKVPSKTKGAYDAVFEKTISIQEHDEQNGSDPAVIGKLVLSLTNKRKLPVRVVVGPLFQRFASFMKRLVPDTWFEALYKTYYHL